MIDSPYVPRELDLASALGRRSVFLFGPRQTGRSSYLREQIGSAPDLSYNLLDRGLLLRLLADPTLIRQGVEARRLRGGLVCIDGIQKCPQLLDEVHLLIEERRIRFLLTGRARESSADPAPTFSGDAVDLLLDGRIAIEVKTTERADPRGLKGLQALREEGDISRAILVTRDPRPRLMDGIEIMPWERFLTNLWANGILPAAG